IAAFDGEVCVGAVKLTETDLMNDAVSIPVSATEPDGKNGFTEGNPIEIRVWHINKSAVSETQSAVVEGDLMYQKRASVFVQMTDQTTTGMNDFESMKIDMFPNPARDNVTLRFSTMPEKGTRIELTDMAGRQLMVREVQSTQEVLNIQPQPAGMYLVKTISGDNYTVKKLIIN
ncbi:MAG: T9SS type A sorting domain-containing protein, partial [Bacteroidales bacterium]|nr:T9SS type A sorting domain-containing protein [Bacteroidales bacterium]